MVVFATGTGVLVEAEPAPGGCLNCISHKPGYKGYIPIRLNGKTDRLHRVVYRHFRGDIPSDREVRHTCDNPRCINIEHLRLGTHADNMADCRLRGRASRGEKNVNSKLTVSRVTAIRNSTESHAALASLHGVDESTIRHARKRKSWQHVED